MDHPREDPHEIAVNATSPDIKPEKELTTFEKRMASYKDQTHFWNDDRLIPFNTSTNQLPAFFWPLKIGNLNLSHRIVLAPLTRMRATATREPNTELATEYYRQRTTKGGLLISESTSISEQGTAYYRTPGIYTDRQVESWKVITQAVHDKGGFIFLQLWHVGRVSHSRYQPDGRLPVAPSPIALQGTVRLPDGTTAEYEVPRELSADVEIPEILEDYRVATKNAALAGFDGVEIQAANGYLIDQFLQESSNIRTDRYGGSIVNRSRFLFEVVEVVKIAWKEAVGASSPSSGNVGVRFSPFGTYNNMDDSNVVQLFQYILEKLDPYQLVFMDIHDQRAAGTSSVARYQSAFCKDPMQDLCRLFKGPVVLTGGYHPVTANEAIVQGKLADPAQDVAVAVGRLFISNPDLPLRVLLRAPISHYDRTTFYTAEAKGYTDQKFLTEEEVDSLVDAAGDEIRHLDGFTSYLNLLRMC